MGALVDPAPRRPRQRAAAPVSPRSERRPKAGVARPNRRTQPEAGLGSMFPGEEWVAVAASHEAQSVSDQPRALAQVARPLSRRRQATAIIIMMPLLPSIDGWARGGLFVGSPPSN